MRMVIPPAVRRRELKTDLATFYDVAQKVGRDDYTDDLFTAFLAKFCEFYEIKAPKIEWYERLRANTAGECEESGTINLIHPQNWAANRVYKEREQWMSVVFHELGHYLLWCDAEPKADLFASRMMAK